MKIAVLITAGIVITVAGVIWALQGFGLIGGSVMTGSSFWAAVGPVVAVLGIVLIAVGWRRRSAVR